MASLLTLNDADDLGIWSTTVVEPEKSDSMTEAKTEAGASTELVDVGLNDVIGDVSGPVISISEAGQSFQLGPRSTEWAELLDVSQPMPDFHQKVPNLAHTW